MKKIVRYFTLLLAIALLLQCFAAAADPQAPTVQEATPEVQETVSDAQDTVPEVPEPLPDEEEVSVQSNFIVSANFSDGDVVNAPRQSLTLSAVLDGRTLSPSEFTVSLGTQAIAAQDGAYPLSLSAGDNLITITAPDGEAAASYSFTLRLELVIPGGWAHDALVFCVQQGILNGDTTGNLLPDAKATRAQLAAMLVRLFRAEREASLSGYSDVPDTAWYRGELSKAVAMGLFEGSGGKLTPDKSITREQAFTVLARALGVASEKTDLLDSFSDGALVSLWARGSIAGMLEAGYIHGTTAGTLNPKGYISRKELAQVLYNALDCITDDPAQLAGSRCLYTGSIEALAGASIPGDLILSVNAPEAVTLDGFKVAGRLVLHLHGANQVTLGEVSQTVAVCCPALITLTAPVEQILCLRDGAYAIGAAENAILLGDTALRGTYDTVTCLGGSPTITAGSRVGIVNIAPCMVGGTLNLHGNVNELHANAYRLTVSSDGQINTYYQYFNNTVVTGKIGTVVDRIDAGLDGVTVTPGAAPMAYYDMPTVTVTGTVGNVDTTQLYGVPGGIRTCSVSYSYGGTILKTERNFSLVDGATLSCEVTPKQTYMQEQTQNVTVTLSYGSQSVSFSLPVRAAGRYTALKEAQNVLTVHVKAVVQYTTSMYSYAALSGYLSTVPGGSVVTFIKKDIDRPAALIEIDGRRGWVPYGCLDIGWRIYHNDDVSYSDEAKEAFVNQVHNYSSPTQYLIWCNLYTTTVNIFQGSQGKWKLIDSCECVIGTPLTPTRVGVFRIYSHAYYWSFDDNGKLDVTRCYFASLFDGGIAFHTRLRYTGTNNLVNSSLSAEISHGCVRCPDEIAKFIYYNCPTGTTVVVY